MIIIILASFPSVVNAQSTESKKIVSSVQQIEKQEKILLSKWYPRMILNFINQVIEQIIEAIGFYLIIILLILFPWPPGYTFPSMSH